MKRTFTLVFIFIGGMEIFGQAGPTGNCQSTFPPNIANSTRAWLRGGNNASGAGGADNIFGTCFNAEILTITNSTPRMKLNGTVSYSVNGYLQPRDGFLLLGQQGNNNLGPLYQNTPALNNGAYSLLHLNGAGTFVQDGGHRDWMRTGITFTSNNDLAYVGHRQAGALDKTELVIGWSDNQSGGPGDDVVSFRFTQGPPGFVNIPSATNNTADLLGRDNDGREVMRLMGSGEVGIGPRFAQTVPLEPKSTLHQHQENAESSWHQFSNQFLAGSPATNNGPTAVSAIDGMRLGILGSTNALQNGIGMLYNQEDRPLLFSVNANTNTATANLTQERMRVSSYATPTALSSTTYGVYQPYGPVNGNRTRVSISHLPTAPLTRPLALLHLGYNNDVFNNTVGHRPWMDVGMFISQNLEHMYVGLKQDQNGLREAVVGYGATQSQNMRFLYTQANIAGNVAATSSGVEIARMWSDGNIGRTGFGSIQPQNTVHINGIAPDDQTAGGVSGLRFQDLTSGTPVVVNPGIGVLAVDANGDVIYVEGAAGNAPGGPCTSPSTATPLSSDWEIPMNTHNFVYTDPAGTLNDGQNFVGIGTGCTPAAKLEVIREVTANTISTVIANRVENRDVATGTNYMGFGQGVSGHANGANRENSGVYGEAKSAQNNIGIRGHSAQVYTGSMAALGNYGAWGNAQEGLNNTGVYGTSSSTNPLSVSSRGGAFFASGTKFNHGAYTSASNAANASVNIGTFGYAVTGSTGNTINNIGVAGVAEVLPGGAATNNIGLYGEGTFSAYLSGPTISGPALSFSDQRIKENVRTIESGLDLLNRLHPVTYDHKSDAYPELHLPKGKQYGFIAQEVEKIIPELVMEAPKPEIKDEKGNVISKGDDLKALNYNGLIPVLTKSIQEQQAQIESLKTQLSEMQQALAAGSNSSGSNSIAVELSDVKSIVLDQNTPNPFAEQTVITYQLTEGIGKAQLLFHNGEGKLINLIELDPKAGPGKVHVFASDLSNGIYTYTLVADGKVIDTKRMIRNK